MSDEANENAMRGGIVEIDQIKRYIPHRFPFLLVDRVLSWELAPEKKITAIKNVTINEPFFPGHFPDQPVMPGVLIIEAMAQAAGVLAGLSMESGSEDVNLFYLVKVDNAKFSKTVVPGDQLLMKVVQTRRRSNMGFFSCESFVDDKRVARCDIMSAGRS